MDWALVPFPSMIDCTFYHKLAWDLSEYELMRKFIDYVQSDLSIHDCVPPFPHQLGCHPSTHRKSESTLKNARMQLPWMCNLSTRQKINRNFFLLYLSFYSRLSRPHQRKWSQLCKMLHLQTAISRTQILQTKFS